MVGLMSGAGGEKSEILDAVVVPSARAAFARELVVDDLRIRQRSADMVGHHLSMFEDIPRTICHWLIRADMEHDVAPVVQMASVAPLGVGRSNLMTSMASDVTNMFSGDTAAVDAGALCN
jgi:hypothetical protein